MSKGKKEDERMGIDRRRNGFGAGGRVRLGAELVTAPVAREITAKVAIPTIGIGSGPDCDGEILVTTDLLGHFAGICSQTREKKLASRGTNAHGGG